MLYNDYKLIVSNNKIYIRDQKTLELIELNFKKESDNKYELYTKEKDIIFYLNNGEYSCINKNKNNILSVNNQSYESPTTDMQYKYNKNFKWL